MTKSEARKAGMAWLKASPLPWPAKYMFARSGPLTDHGRVVHVGYIRDGGTFVEVAHLRFGEAGSLEFVKDRRERRTVWPDEGQEAA